MIPGCTNVGITPGGCAAGLDGVFFKSLAGKYAGFGRMAERLKRPWGTRTG